MKERFRKQLPYELSLPYLRDHSWASRKQAGRKDRPAVVAVSCRLCCSALFFVNSGLKGYRGSFGHGIRERSSIEGKKICRGMGLQFEIEHVVVHAFYAR